MWIVRGSRNGYAWWRRENDRRLCERNGCRGFGAEGVIAAVMGELAERAVRVVLGERRVPGRVVVMGGERMPRRHARCCLQGKYQDENEQLV